jgi:ABC-type nitrate/sulfonate/bicarbonate transport system permease component
MNDSLSSTLRSFSRAFLRNKWVRSSVIVIVSLAIFVAVWWLLALYLNLEYLPPPDRVANAFVDSFQKPDPGLKITMWQNIWASLQRFLYGFSIAFLIAVPLGLLMGFSRIIYLLANPIVEVLRPIPPIAWVPVLLIALGLFFGPVIAVFIGVVFPLLSNVIFGVRSVDPSLLDAARTQGANRAQLFGKVVFPFTVPFLMTGVRIGLGIGWMCIVAAEMIGAVGGGVGYYIIYKRDLGIYPDMYVGMVVIAILGIFTTILSGYVERYLRVRMGMK